MKIETLTFFLTVSDIFSVKNRYVKLLLVCYPILSLENKSRREAIAFCRNCIALTSATGDTKRRSHTAWLHCSSTFFSQSLKIIKKDQNSTLNYQYWFFGAKIQSFKFLDIFCSLRSQCCKNETFWRDFQTLCASERHLGLFCSPILVNTKKSITKPWGFTVKNPAGIFKEYTTLLEFPIHLSFK